MKKFELTNEFVTNSYGAKLFRIKALITLPSVKAGGLGGYIEKEGNLSQYGNAWVSGDAWVSGNARVYGDALVRGDAQVSDNAWVYGNALVYDNARVYGDAQVSDNAWVYGDAQVSDNAWVYGDARVCGDALVYGDAQVSGDAWVCDNAWVYGDEDYAYAHGFGSVNRTTTFFRLKDGGVGVRCGCFYGTLPEFRDKIRETHGESAIAEEYLDLAALMEKRFRRTGNEQKTEEES